MKKERKMTEGGCLFRIFVDQAANGRISGRVSGGTLPQEVLFSSLSRLILLLEELMDAGGTPKMLADKNAETPAFELEILFRHNYSWQGKLRQTKDGKETTFHSVLELLILMETALER